MTDDLDKKVDRLLKDGQSKRKIWKDLKKSSNEEDLAFLLNELPSFEKRRKYLLLHLLLAAILLAITLLKLYNAVEIGRISLYFFTSLVIPAINIFVLRKLLRFRRTGYQFLFILSVIALFHPENHYIVEFSVMVTMIVLSGFLYIRVFPRKERITAPAKQGKSDD